MRADTESRVAEVLLRLALTLPLVMAQRVVSIANGSADKIAWKTQRDALVLAGAVGLAQLWWWFGF